MSALTIYMLVCNGPIEPACPSSFTSYDSRADLTRVSAERKGWSFAIEPRLTASGKSQGPAKSCDYCPSCTAKRGAS